MSVILVSLHCIVGIAMTGMYYLLYVFSSRMPVELTGGALMTLHELGSDLLSVKAVWQTANDLCFVYHGVV